MKLYEIGKDKIENELNLVKIIKNLKYMRILMKTNEKIVTLKKLKHDPKMVIDLDGSYNSADLDKSGEDLGASVSPRGKLDKLSGADLDLGAFKSGAKFDTILAGIDESIEW